MTRDHETTLGIERPEAIETTDVNSRGVLIFLAALFGALIVALLIVNWLYLAFSARIRGESAAYAPKVTSIPPPRIQARPLRDIWNLRKREDSMLNSYGWVQRETGVARIPIDRAIEVLAARDLPARTGPEPGPTVADTGPESGGPQTGAPMPRFNRPADLEPNNPPQVAPVPGPPVPRTAVPGGQVSEANR